MELRKTKKIYVLSSLFLTLFTALSFTGIPVHAQAEGVTDAKIVSSQDDGKTAVNGDTITVSFKANSEEEAPEGGKLKNKDLKFTVKKDSDDYLFSASFKADDNEDQIYKGNDVTGVQFNGEDVTFDGEVDYYAKAHVSSISVDGGTELKNKKYLKSGSTVKVSFSSDKKLLVSGYPKLGSLKGTAFTEEHQNDRFVYTSTIKVTGTIQDNANLHLDLSDCSYKQDHYDTVKIANLGVSEQNFIYSAPLEITDFKFINAPTDNIIYNGCELGISFKSNHDLKDIDKLIYIGKDGKETYFSLKQDGDIYTGSVKVPANTFKNLDKISLKANLAQDIYGNTCKISLPTDSFIYYAPLKSGESILNCKAETDNKGIDGFQALVRNNNHITASFESTRPVHVTNAVVRGSEGFQPMTVDSPSDGKGKWHFTYEVEDQAFPDNDSLDIEITVIDNKDYNNNQIVLKSGTDFSFNKNESIRQAKYYAPIKIHHLSFNSDNEKKSSLAKNGNVVTLSFSTTHPVNVDNVSIAGGDAKVSSSPDRMSFVITKTVDDSFKSGTIPFSISLKDNAGNTAHFDNQDTKDKVTYYPPLKLASKPAITSSNDRDGKKYCKTGDTVTLAFKLNHDAQTKGSVAGVARSDEGESPKLSAKIAGGLKDLSEIAASATSEDAAGNVLEVSNKESENQITYYAPITGSANVSATGGKTPGYIKNGCTVTTRFESNLTSAHKTDITHSTVNGRSIGSASGNTATYHIPEGESSLPEGKITCSVDVDDPAGNTFKATDGTDIVYDRTKPNVKIGPDVNGFYNKDVKLDIGITDTNLDGNDIQILVNGSNQYKGGANGSSYDQKVVFGDEKEYSMNVVATDKAGNTSKGNSGNVVIDKTNPKIIKVNLKNSKKPVYKSGFILGEHFKITDKFLKNVSCLLTHKSGFGQTISWNIMQPDKFNGLNEAEISAEDMAQNFAKKLNYSFYIDGENPSAILQSRKNNIELKNTSLLTLTPSDKLMIHLDKKWMGDEKADHFTKLAIESEDGTKTIKNLLPEEEMHKENINLNGLNGRYRLSVKAKDDVGNEMPEKIYMMSVKKANKNISIASLPSKNTSKVKRNGLIAGISALAAAAIATVIIIIKRR